MFAVAECTIRSRYEFHPVEFNGAVIRFRDAVWNVWREADRKHLLGSYLLVACQAAVNAGPDECERLLDNLSELDVQTRAVCHAAEDLCHYLAALDQKPSGPNDEQTEVENCKEIPIREVIVSYGKTCCVLRTAGHDPFTMNEEETRMFRDFVHLVALKSPAEIVPWQEINKAAGHTEPKWCEKQHPAVAKAFSRLNVRLRTWCNSPGGEDWIGRRMGKKGGRYLNKSVLWLPYEENDVIRALARKSSSIFEPLLDPHKAERSTPARGQKLPAQPRRDASDDLDDEGD